MGQYRFKDINGNIVAQISASADGNIIFSGSTIDFSLANNIQLGEVQLAGTASNALLLDGFDSTAFVFTSSFNTISSSISSQLNNLQTTSGSNIVRLNNIESVTGSYETNGRGLVSGSSQITLLLPTGTISGSSQIIEILSPLNSKTGSYATTGSNTFFGTQTYSGSVYIVNDLIVQGSSSMQYISASSVSIGTNIVELNTANPSVRFAGLTISDSGSIGGSGSFLYDSVQDEFLFVHRGNGINVTSSHFVLGPETYDNLGNETYLTNNRLPKGTGKEHLIDSNISDDGSLITLGSNIVVNGTLVATGTTLVSSSAQVIGILSSLNAVSASLIAKTGSLATTGSNTFFANQIISGNVLITGSVGIGITNPTYKFEVNGNGKFNSQLNVTSVLNVLKSDFSTTGGQLAYDSNVNQLYLWNSISNGYFSIYTNTAERLTITSGGNVGIGVSIPLSKLDVSTSTTEALCIGNNSNTITSGDLIGALSFVSRDSSTFSSGGITNIRSYATSTYNTGNVSGDLRFYVSNGLQNTTAAALFGTEAMRITNEGKIGIGTTNPGYKLTVVSDTTAALLVQATNATVGSPILDFYDNGRSQETIISSTDGTTTGTYIASYSNHPLMFGANVGSSPTAKMVIATNGNVGIATATANAKLDVYGTARIWHGNSTNYTQFHNSNEINHYAANGNADTMYLNWVSGGGVNIARNAIQALSAGNVGIGEGANTVARLNVNGSTKINRSFYNWYQGYWTGNGTYWHMKTNMSAGLGGNTQYTMSLFKGYFYAYSSPPALEGTYVFHNWDGAFYNVGATGNLFVTAYRSSDNYVVLVTYSGNGEAGLTLDWHQAYAYPFVNAQVTAAGLHGSTTGKY
jgi:hypothetical protein